jgi:hypothetical protein
MQGHNLKLGHDHFFHIFSSIIFINNRYATQHKLQKASLNKLQIN